MKRHWLRTAIILILSVSLANAHTLHESTAEVSYNPETKKLEVSLTVFISDLEVAVIIQSQREMRFERTPAAEYDVQIHRYLTNTFLVSDSSGKGASIEWVGRRTDPENAKSNDPTVTLFFEIALSGNPALAQLRNGVFCELFKDQINFVQVKISSRNLNLDFTPSSGYLPLMTH